MASKWLIIGGGIHGTHLSLHLTQRGGVKPQDIRVLDPFPAPLAMWQTVTQAVGMEYLRSPTVHNLHWDQGSLGLYARINRENPHTRFIPPFGRPSLALFNAHNAHLIRKFGLDALRIQGRAQQLTRTASGWRAETEHGALDADRVILAIGMSEQPFWPTWALPYKGTPQVKHVFDLDFDRPALPDWEHAAVVGGGITAAQLALSLVDRNPGAVSLIRRHDERVFDFDSDVGWMNATNLRGFALVPDFDERRRIIKQARHRGSMPGDVRASLRAAIESGALTLIPDSVESMTSQDGITLTTREGRSISANLVVLATGYVQSRPGGRLIDDAIAAYDLPVASDGYPTPSPTLEWAPGLYVSGPLAELEVGPASRNIIGARMAGQRLVAVSV